MSQSARSSEFPLYEYKALTGDDIRVIQLQPGRHSQDLYAKIAHVRLKLSPTSSAQDGISISAINRSLPAGWESFRTPEGRFFYVNMRAKGSTCQYNHPFPDSVPQELLMVLKSSQIESHRLGIDERDRYEALSYVWGDPKSDDVLYLRDSEGAAITSKILVTSNLSSALRHLRHTLEPRLLWVDAICIDQDNETEKNRQVLRIPDIYRSAWRVIGWLGEASLDSRLAIETMHYLGEQIEISRSFVHHTPPGAKEKEWINLAFKLPYSTEQWTALASIMKRSWFERLWVLQEITLANPNAIVQCGNDTITYSLFRRAVVGLRMRLGMPDSLYQRIERRVSISYGLQNTSLFSLILKARDHDCSVPHDKIYGLLGFVGPKLRDTIRPSYQTPFVETFKELFCAHSDSTGRLELLAHCFPSEDDHMPSWVSDWRSYGDITSSIPWATTLAAGMSKADFREVRLGELHVSGIHHGAVTTTFEILDSTKGDRTGRWLRTLIKECRMSAEYPTAEDNHQAFAKLLCRNHLQERFPQATTFDTMEQWQNTLDLLLAHDSSKLSDDSDLEGFVRSQWNFWQRRKFFRTEHGYLGSGPMGMREGDELCILLGLYCPLVIRSSGSEHFKIIGGCYLHGLMDSEALLGRLPNHYTVQQYVAGVRYLTRYYNTNTGEATVEDPRLGPLDPHWQRVDLEITADDPQHVDFFRNIQTGEVINYDPRLSKTALEQRGVQLRNITLI